MHAQTITEPTPRLITVAEFVRMGRAGVFAPDERIELLDGQLMLVPPQKNPHAWCVERLSMLLILGLVDRARVRPQLPLVLDPLSMPLPDLLVSAPGDRRHPRADQVLLAIEVADTSIAYDRGRKLHAYARNDVPEYWIVDLPARRVQVSTRPRGETYAETRLAGRGETIAPTAFPDLVLSVDDFMPDEDLFATPD
jgi:Uma2 family endonuclease